MYNNRILAHSENKWTRATCITMNKSYKLHMTKGSCKNTLRYHLYKVLETSKIRNIYEYVHKTVKKSKWKSNLKLGLIIWDRRRSLGQERWLQEALIDLCISLSPKNMKQIWQDADIINMAGTWLSAVLFSTAFFRLRHL